MDNKYEGLDHKIATLLKEGIEVPVKVWNYKNEKKKKGFLVDYDSSEKLKYIVRLEDKLTYRCKYMEPIDVFFKPDGTKMYVLDSTADSVFQYTLSTPWDVSTASYGTKLKED